MTKLVVEVLDAADLMPKEGDSANPFVEVHFDNQKQRTLTKHSHLNPYWNQKLLFDISDPKHFPNMTIDVVVFHERKSGHRRDFLGRVRIYGISVPLSQQEANIQRYPLDKRGIFSHIKGDIGFKMYMVHNDNEINREELHVPSHGYESKKDKDVKTFHSIGTAPTTVATPPSIEFKRLPLEGTRMDFAQAGSSPATVMHSPIPKQNPEFALVETNPPLAAKLGYGYRGKDKIISTYDMVEQMHFLYVNVVKAKDLPVMDVSGSLDPYVIVKVGNYKGVTKHLEKTQNPVWKQIFAFSKDRLQATLLEVIVKDKDLGKDDFVGRVFFNIPEVGSRVPPDSPLAPQWFKLVDKKGIKAKGELMLAVWMGTQADESFPEAWHSDAHSINHDNLANTRSKVYFSPKLYYLRAQVIEAQDIIPSDKSKPPDTYVRIQFAGQGKVTKPSQMKVINPVWNEELMFVGSEPFEDFVIISVEGKGTGEILGRVIIPSREVQQRLETTKLPDDHWYNLHRPFIAKLEETEKKKEKFSSKIHVRLWFDSGYHVLDESTHFSSDLQPPSKILRKNSIGVLELGILSARKLNPMKSKEGRTTDAYCVAKYGTKWVRTRTLLDTLTPLWNEQYTWEVYDPCTVITIAVFDNAHTSGSKEDAKDQRIGKVRIRLSTLETEKVYTHYYPLLVLQPSGLKKNGELHLAIRFTCTAWAKMLTQYGKPLLPKMHYLQPIPAKNMDLLRSYAMNIVATRLSRAEPPLRREVVEYMLDVDVRKFSLRRSKANFNRIMLLISGITAIYRWFTDVCIWKNPITTCLVHILLLILICYPELILPTIFLYLFVIGIWNHRFRSRFPPYMDTRLSQAEQVLADELEEEFDNYPTTKHIDTVRMRYDRLRSVAGKVQTVVGDLATQGERAQAILGWRDPRATSLFIIFALMWAVFIYVTPIQVVAILIGLYVFRHPRFRRKLPAVPVNFFRRLPSKADMMLL